MDQVLEQTILTPEELETIEHGGRVPAGFDRKVYLTRDFMDSLHEVGLADRDLHGFADRILIVQGTADEVVPYEAVRGFADRNGLRLISVEDADHRFLDPAKMDIVLNSFMEHLGI
jgi:pimeloyl-ACP methyl ester carboxylesterase